MKGTTLVIAMVVSTAARAEAPAVLDFTGTLSDAQGAPVDDGTYDLTFGVYDAAEGGGALWEETDTVETVSGVFSVELGYESEIDPAVFENASNLWLALTVGDDALDPRLPIASVPWALVAGRAAAATTAETATTAVTATSAEALDCEGCVGAAEIDATAVQRRILAECAPGEAVRAIAEDGQVVCETDDDLAYEAGGGLVLAGATLSIADGGVVSTMIADGAVTLSHWADAGCDDGEIPKWDADATAWACAEDIDTGIGSGTTYDAGAGLALDGTTFAISFAGASCLDTEKVVGFTDLGALVCGTDTDTDSGGTVTSITAGAGLTGGTIETIGTIALDTAIVPRLGAANEFTAANTFGGAVGVTGALTVGGFTLASGAGAGRVLTSNVSGNASWVAPAPSSGWALTGNAGTTAGTSFVGTTDSVALEMRVNGARALRLEPDVTTPNLLGGNAVNTTTGASGGVIAGGGVSGEPNSVSSFLGVIGGGCNNTVTGMWGVVPGGRSNLAGGNYSFAAGYGAHANETSSFVWGDSMAATVNSNGAHSFTARASGGVWFYSNPAMTAGVTLASGGGSWSTISDRDAKNDLREVDGEALLGALARVPIATWSYKAQDPSIRHIGPMAQDFHAAFGVGEDERRIATVDADGVALAAIQALKRDNDRLRARVEALERRAPAAAR